MNESISGIVLGIVGFLGLTYVAVKVRQNQRHLYRMVGVIGGEQRNEINFLVALADSGQLLPYSPEVVS